MSHKWIKLCRRKDGMWDAISMLDEKTVLGTFVFENDARLVVDTCNDIINEMARKFIREQIAKLLPDIITRIEKRDKEHKRESTR
jgi:hypothetical protein